MGLSLDGLVSGLDTAALIDALMDVQSIPRALLKTKVDDKGVIITQLQSLNTSLQDLLTQAKKAAAPGALSAYRTTSSSDALTATAASGATPSTTDVVVDRVATAQTLVTAALSAWPDDPPVLTLVDAAGERVEITAASSSPADVARAINATGPGVAATAVAAGTDASGAPLFRLQLSATETGTAGAFQLFRGDAAAVDAGPAVDVA